jgi:hypothetical protein
MFVLAMIASLSDDVVWRFAHGECLRSRELDHGMVCPMWSENPGNLIKIDVVGNVINADAPEKSPHCKSP